ncbi:unnamed protein product [Prunus armeniaca]
MSCTRGAVPFKSTVHGPNSEAEPQICDSPDLPLHALLLNCFRLLSYATPRSSPPINWAPERNENENAAGPTHCRNYWDFFFFFLLDSIIARRYKLTDEIIPNSHAPGSHQNSEVKRVWARVVLGWVTILGSPRVASPLFCLFEVSIVVGRLLSVVLFIWLSTFSHEP